MGSVSDEQMSLVLAVCGVVLTVATVVGVAYAVHDSRRARGELDAALQKIHLARVNLAASSVPRSVFDPAEEL